MNNKDLPEDIEQIKFSFEHILNSSIDVKRKKKSESDVDRELFIEVINSLENIDIRAGILGMDLNIDLTKYDELFFKSIDNLILLKYGKAISEIIYFYVYDRLDEDGNIVYLKDTNGNPVVLENPNDLWHLVQRMHLASSVKK